MRAFLHRAKELLMYHSARNVVNTDGVTMLHCTIVVT
jgi:hypothetical protein